MDVTVAQQRHRAVAGIAYARDREHLTIGDRVRIAVVAQQLRLREADGCVFGCRCRLTGDYRDVVDRCDVQTGHGAGHATSTITHRVAELRCTVVIGFGGEVHLLRAADRDQLHCAVRSRTNRGNAQHLGVGRRVLIGVVCQQTGG